MPAAATTSACECCEKCRVTKYTHVCTEFQIVRFSCNAIRSPPRAAPPRAAPSPPPASVTRLPGQEYLRDMLDEEAVESVRHLRETGTVTTDTPRRLEVAADEHTKRTDYRPDIERREALKVKMSQELQRVGAVKVSNRPQSRTDRITATPEPLSRDLVRGVQPGPLERKKRSTSSTIQGATYRVHAPFVVLRHPADRGGFFWLHPGHV
jgi:hypothetical protein